LNSLDPFDVSLGQRFVFLGSLGSFEWGIAPSTVSAATYFSAFGHCLVIVRDLVLLNHFDVGCQKFIEECEALGVGDDIIFAVFNLSSSECGVLALPGV